MPPKVRPKTSHTLSLKPCPCVMEELFHSHGTALVAFIGRLMHRSLLIIPDFIDY